MQTDCSSLENNNHIKVFLPNKLIDSLPKCAALPKERQRWNTNEEIASYLTSFEKHEEWLSGSPRTRPLNGSIILYNRKKVKYRKDGYCWKKRKDGKTTREDHMKLKVQGMECLYGCYVHSSIIPTFHRRCYWLLQNPDIVLVHYLNVPATEDCGKICGPILSPINSDRKEWLKWSKEELICQLKPMFHCIKWTCSNGNGGTEFSVEQLVHQVLESHQSKPQPRTHTCLCNSGLGSPGNLPHKCNSTKHRIISPKVDLGLTPCSALTEVQNLSVTDSKDVAGEGKVSLQDKKLVKLPTSVPRVNGSSEVSSSGPLDRADPVNRSPGTHTNGCYGDRELASIACVTSVPNLSVATVTCSIPRNAVILMTGVGDKPVSLAGSGLTPSQQLTVSSQAAALGGHELAQAPSALGLALVPSSESSLVLSETHMDTSEPSVTFDPDSFLNSPKQGQTYGGGGGTKESSGVPAAFPALGLADSLYLDGRLKSEAGLESERSETESGRPDFRIPPAAAVSGFPPAPGLVPAAPCPALESPALGSVTALDNMDYTNTASPKSYPGIFPHPSPAGSALPRVHNPFFIEDDKGSGSGSETHHAPPETLKTEAVGQFPQEPCDGRAKDELGRAGGLRTAVPEGETPMDTSQLTGDADGSGLQKGAAVERPVKLEADYGVGRRLGGDVELPCGNVNELYSIIQSELPPSHQPPTNIELAIDHFDISFDSQFPDLIPDFMADSGGDGGRAYGQFANVRAAKSPEQAVAPLIGYSPQQQHQASQQPAGADSTVPFLELPAAPADLTRITPSSTPECGPTVTITDFSPDWSYPEGGVKVLITGPWGDGTDGFSCVFDQVSVPAALIQSGVLRCYCPAHEAGLVRLHVARETPPLISDSVLFEYRARNTTALPSSQLDWLSLDDNQFRMSILERLEQMEKRMAEMAASSQQQPVRAGDKMQIQASSDSFEERIIALCLTMMSQSWLAPFRAPHSRHQFPGMTLLHLAAAQGYSRLIETLIKWRSLNADSLDLEQEVDPLNVDHFSCTPLVSLCGPRALGHVDAAVTLYGWNRRALFIPDSLGRLPLHVARSRGHVRLATRLESYRDRAAWGPATHLPPHCPRARDPLSVTSAYSTGSATRDSPATSPELCAHGDPDIAMEICESQQTVNGSTRVDPAGCAGKVGLLWYLPTQLQSRQGESPRPAPGAHFFLDDEATLVTHGNGQFSMVTGRDSMETDLRFNENAENEEFLPPVDVLQVDMIALAEQIIDATPERIKQEDFTQFEAPLKERQDNATISHTMTLAGQLPGERDQLPNFSQHRSACSQPLTPLSHACLSPVSSPLSDITFERGDGPANTGWSDFLNASANGKMESEFALLTLSDHEQRELYEAARIIQTAFRKYKGRRLKEQQEVAAAVIQRCYRKYKQLTWIALKYALYKKMTQAAILIQSKFRSYYEQKRFQQSRRAAVLIQQYYRSYKEYEKLKQAHRGSGPLQQKMKASFLTKKQDQAARKIMRFLRRCRHRMKEVRQSQELEAVPIHGLTT
ncbi:LOW QUALITY PROTEIN: calmodulin-binding transcription activator 2-like [Pristis pectinata]|uniref:LOW QUALITY PROTEIN: calmodulin-binding transcription activator 2-like n=1 Tax=Pristis pectinata TaxID=685728 RepID=UPI00223D0DA3|nr:LOW QUALITY PROTEIN: calmodulin-binding transcription activator 2-like [Pristis pectinata]